MSMNDAAADGERILALLMEKRGDGSVLANDLLRALQRGFPIDRLRSLLEHEDPELVRLGAWIQSELGGRASSLLSLLPALLQNKQKYVRFFALDSVISCATSRDGPLVAAAVKLVDDPDDAVRWKIVEFLRVAPEQLLRAGAASMKVDDENLRRGLVSLLNARNAPDETQVLLASDNAVLRRFGLAAALRNNQDAALKVAGESADQELAAAALEALASRSLSQSK